MTGQHWINTKKYTKKLIRCHNFHDLGSFVLNNLKISQLYKTIQLVIAYSQKCAGGFFFTVHISNR